jgi:hypothetical protein
MPLLFPAEPPNGSKLVRDYANNFGRRLATRKDIPGFVSRHTPLLKLPNDVYAPHPVYKTGLGDILEGTGLQNASYAGFFYVLENNKGLPHARAHVVSDEFGVSHFSSLSFGTYSKLTVPILVKLASHDSVRNASYEVRCLRCKGCLFTAIWLKSNDEVSSDLIHPLEEAYNLLSGEPPYPADDFMQALASVAQKFERHSDANFGQGVAP